MRLGVPTWSKRFGPFDIDLDDLTQISFPKDGGKRVEEIKKDIEINGLKYPLEVHWWLEESKWDKLEIYKGNQRFEALRKLGWKKAPCYLTIEGYQDNEGIGKVITLLLENKK